MRQEIKATRSLVKKRQTATEIKQSYKFVNEHGTTQTHGHEIDRYLDALYTK